MTDKQIIIDKKCPIAEKCKEFENCKIQNILQQLDQLKADNKHLNDLLNQALKELEQSREAIKKVKEIANSIINDDVSLANLFSFIVQIDNICDEVTE